MLDLRNKCNSIQSSETTNQNLDIDIDIDINSDFIHCSENFRGIDLANPLDSLDVSEQSLDRALSLRTEFESSEPKEPIEKLEIDSCKISKLKISKSSPPKVPKKSKKVI